MSNVAFKEEDIRPLDLFNEYLRLASIDAQRFFSDRSSFTSVACPACKGESIKLGLTKHGFRYVTCLDCDTLYLSPRPTPEAINAFYREGLSVAFWATDFFKKTADSRRKLIFRPRAALVAEYLAQEGLRNLGGTFADIGSGYGIFLEEIAALGIFESVIGIEPSPQLADVCRQKGFDVIEKPAEAILPDECQISFASAFEVLEHLYEPAELLQSIYDLLIPGGVLLFTTLTVTGFDIQVLWERSNSVFPPHHINLISVSGMRQLIERIGFELIELSTPGELDVDIVINTLADDSTLEVPRFVSQILNHPQDSVRVNFQKFLQANELSSHIRILARKP